MIWFWIPIVQIVAVDWFHYHRIEVGDIPAKMPWFYLGTVSLLSFLLFIGFVKFYRRYSQTVLLGILTIDCSSQMPMHYGQKDTGGKEEKNK